MHVPFFNMLAQTREMELELSTAMSEVLRRGDFILGQAVASFEKAFSAYLGTSYAIGVANGLDALRLSLQAFGVGRGDEVILPANTFIATAFAVSNVGATPVLVDCDDTYNLDVHQLPAALSSRTRAVIPVHLTGQAADMAAVLAFARDHRLVVIEDACQSHGALYREQKCGSLGDVGCFSFYPAKNLGALGDGGLVATSDEKIAQRLCRLRNYGQEAKHQHVERGLNSRLDTLQAAVLEIKLRYLDAENARRREHAAEYRERLQGVGDLRFQSLLADTSHVYHLFVVETQHRDDLRHWLTQRGIETGMHYPTPIHLQPVYADLDKPVGSFPRAELLAKRCLSLPMFPHLDIPQIEYVIDSLRGFYS